MLPPSVAPWGRFADGTRSCRQLACGVRRAVGRSRLLRCRRGVPGDPSACYGLGFDEAGALPVQFANPVEAAVAAGNDGDLRVRHEAAAGAGLLRAARPEALRGLTRRVR